MSTRTPVPSGSEPAVEVPARSGALSGGLGLVVVALLLGIAGYTTYRTFTSPPSIERQTQYADMICSKTLKHFKHLRVEGEAVPVPSPFSKERTGYPAEKCFWTKDGAAKLEPDYILLNEYIGKTGPTMCPVCGRLVVAHNPLPPADKMDAAMKSSSGSPSSTGLPVSTSKAGTGDAH
jgi:hypothetical protein